MQSGALALPSQPRAAAALLDDLCALGDLCAAAGIDDAALACAAAEAPSAVASLAGILYVARRIGADAGLPSMSETQRTKPAAGNGAFADACFSDAESALAAAQAHGSDVVAVPREFLAAISCQGAQRIDAALSRLLRAAYGGRALDVVDALAAFPFCVDRLEVQRALHAADATDARGDVKAMAARIKGGEARDTAMAAAAIIAALQELGRSALFTLQAALDRGFEGLADMSPSLSDQREQYAVCRTAAQRADAIWKTQPGTPARVQANNLLDGLSMQAHRGLVLVPAGALDVERSPYELRFADAESRLVDPEEFLVAAGGATAQRRRPLLVACPLVRASLACAGAGWDKTWTWPAGEEAEPVVARGMTFSASRLNSFVKCSRRWFFEYLCDAIEEPVSMQSAYGRALHVALEDLHREFRVPGDHAPAPLLQRLQAALDASFGASRADFASQLEYEVCRQRGRRVAEQYVRWLANEARRAPLEVSAVEVAERFTRGGHQFVGYIDRIDRPRGGGPVTIYDYKTGRIDDNAAGYLEKVRSGEEAQLALYFAMRSEHGDEVRRIALVSLRDPRDPVWILALDIVADGHTHEPVEQAPGVLRATCTREDLDTAFAALLERCDMLTQTGIRHFEPGEDPPCGYCGYNLACRERPVRGERIFAR